MSEENDNAGIIAHPPFFYLTAALIAIAIDWAIPLSFGNQIITEYIGIAVLIAGIIIFVASGRMFVKNKQSPSVHASQPKVITDGIYGKTRNPIYLSAHLLLAAPALYFDNVWMLLTLIPMTIIMTKVVIEKEEAYLSRKFGDEYKTYMKNVRRWF